MTKRCIVIGAGIGGLTTAAILARRGINVTVLEAHIYPGGCAGTFFHQNYMFDAGATLAAGFYPGGPMDKVAIEADMDGWDYHPLDPAMVVHLPSGMSVIRWGDEKRHEERLQAFGPAGEKFWAWQERTANSLWDLAMQAPPWPPQTLTEKRELLATGINWLGKVQGARSLLNFMIDAGRTVSSHLNGAPKELVQFIDAQLLISAQTTSRRANALFGAAALDLPRRGPAHLKGGIGTIAENLAGSIEKHGGRVLYRREVKRITFENGKPTGVETKRGEWFPADIVVANLPPWNIRQLTDGQLPGSAGGMKETGYPRDGWGAFTIYAGVEESVFSEEMPLHHQILVSESPGEGNTIFLSISPPGDDSRAPSGRRAVTLSTHTAISPWWTLYQADNQSYNLRKDAYTDKLLSAVDKVMPGFQEGAELVLPGTPVTFQRFTRRTQGWVGGFPQTNLFRTMGPKLLDNLWMVGDSIFPGQSVPAVALGGLRVARSILREVDPINAHKWFGQGETNKPSLEKYRYSL